jgi:hypothetical protein
MQFKNLQDQQDFEIWAFGTTPMQYGEHALHTWNSRHGDKLWLTTDELIKHSLEKMHEVYVKESKEQTNDPASS